MEIISSSASGGSSEGEEEDGVVADATMLACLADGGWSLALRSHGFGGCMTVLDSEIGTGLQHT